MICLVTMRTERLIRSLLLAWCGAAQLLAQTAKVPMTPEDLIGVLHAIAPQVGGPRIIAAAPEIMVAMGLPLDEEGQA